jgi:hypothetical protein
VDDGLGVVYDNADIYNATTSTWFSSTLSVARYNLCGAGTDSIALFAGELTLPEM